MHKLLLADDSVTIQRVIELTFSGEDVQVVAVNDGEQAIARIPLEHPDVVLADIGMPRKGGYDVAAFVKGRPDLAHIPVLLLAGAFEPVDQARAEQVRADGVLIKPFEPRQVIERVKELLAAGQQRRAGHTPPIIEGSLAHPTVEAGQSLDDLFESLNQALTASAKATATVVAPEPVEAAVTPGAVAPPPALPESSISPAAVNREPELSFEPLVVQRSPAGSLDDYFDRLSAAFTYTKASATPARLPERVEVAGGVHAATNGFAAAPSVTSPPTRDGVGPPQEWLTLPGSVANGTRSDGHNHRLEGNPILDAVTTLLAQPTWLTSKPEEPVVTREAAPDSQDIVDAITERVLAKLAPAVAESLRQIAQQEIERRRQGNN